MTVARPIITLFGVESRGPDAAELRTLQPTLRLACQHLNDLINTRRWLSKSKWPSGVGIVVAGSDRTASSPVTSVTSADADMLLIMLTADEELLAAADKDQWRAGAWEVLSWLLNILANVGESIGVGRPPLKGSPPSYISAGLTAGASPSAELAADDRGSPQRSHVDEGFFISRNLPPGTPAEQATTLGHYEKELDGLIGREQVASSEVNVCLDRITWALPPGRTRELN